MKSAYELAMERMEREFGPTRKLSDEQKAKLAEIDKKHDAREAELRLGHEQKLASATSVQELEALKTALAAELQSLAEKRQQEKDAVWEGA